MKIITIKIIRELAEKSFGSINDVFESANDGHSILIRINKKLLKGENFLKFNLEMNLYHCFLKHIYCSPENGDFIQLSYQNQRMIKMVDDGEVVTAPLGVIPEGE